MVRGMEEFAATFTPLQRSLTALQPDLVIYDFVSLAAQIIIENLGIPSIKFFTTYASNEHYNLLAQSFAKHDNPTQADFQQAQALIDEHCSAAGYPGYPLIVAMNKVAEQNFVFLPRALQPEGLSFDGRFHFVGPCFEPGDTVAAEALIPPGEGPVMVISLGSLFHEWPEFFQNCISAFGNTAWRVVMSIGTRLDPSVLGVIPANFTIRPHIPQVGLLPHADVFITHGGMNSTMESLSYGVPMVVIPQIEEQAITARQVAELSLGVYLDRAEVSVTTLSEAVATVYGSESIRAPVAKMQSNIREAGGPVKASAIVENLLTQESSSIVTEAAAGRQLH